MTDGEILQKIVAYRENAEAGYSEAIELLSEIEAEMDRRAGNYEGHFQDDLRRSAVE